MTTAKQWSEMKTGTTPSQRLRFVLFRLWQSQENKMDFELFYRMNIDEYIEAIKEELKGGE